MQSAKTKNYLDSYVLSTQKCNWRQQQRLINICEFLKVIYFYTSFFSFKTTFVPVLQPNWFIFCLSIMVTIDGYDSLLRLEKYFILGDQVNLLWCFSNIFGYLERVRLWFPSVYRFALFLPFKERLFKIASGHDISTKDVIGNAIATIITLK